VEFAFLHRLRAIFISLDVVDLGVKFFQLVQDAFFLLFDVVNAGVAH
jgi:hypothetical protein